jgi:2-aminoethylphosphonate-pyruvate transaminase
VQVFHALDQALGEWFEETELGRYHRYLENYNELVAGLQRLGFRPLLPAEQRSRLVTAVIEPTHVAYDYNNMHDYLYERGFTIYPDKGSVQGAFRLASFGQIDRSDIRAFLSALEQYLIETDLLGHLYNDGD